MASRAGFIRLSVLAILLLGCCSGTVLAGTITVSSTLQVVNPGASGNGDGQCQLSEAIRAANTDLAVDGCSAGNGADMIVLQEGTYTLTLPDNMLNDGYNGLPRIESKITIQGMAAETTIIERSTLADKFRFFEITSSGDLTLNDVLVRNGSSSYNGGAVLNFGKFAANRVVFRNNSVVFVTAHSSGGGGAVAGDATLTNSVFVGNTAGDPSTFSSADGGALLCPTECVMTDSTFWSNKVGYFSEVGALTGDGGAIAGGKVSIIRCDFLNNHADWRGGAVRASGGTITDSLFEQNNALVYGGAVSAENLAISGSTFLDNWLDPNYGYDGAAIVVSSGSASISNTSFARNSGIDDGTVGCIYDGSVTLNNVTAIGNSSWFPDWGSFGCGDLHNSIVDDYGLDPKLVPGDPGPMVGAETGEYSKRLIPTWRPAFGSAALDKGDPLPPGSGGTACEAKDQRGTPRPIDGDNDGVAICDLGAYEAGISGVADLAVTLVPTHNPVEVGGWLVYQLTVSNAGPDTAHYANTRFAFACGGACPPVDFQSASTTLGSCTFTDCRIGDLPAGNVATITLTFLAREKGSITATASLLSGDADPDAANNSASATVTIQHTNFFDLTVTRAGNGVGSVSSVPAGISCGSTCIAEFAAGTAVTLTAAPDANSSFAGWSGACTGASTCVITMDDHKDVTATFSSPADLAVSITDSPDPIVKGGQLTYHLVINNSGPGSAANVVLTDTLPPATTFVSATANRGCSHSAGVVTCNFSAAGIAGIGTGGVYVFVDIVVTANELGTLTNSVTATTTSPDSNAANNTAAATTTVIRDTTAPAVSFTAPAAGATLSGAALTVSAAASDDIGVAGVQFKLDGAALGAEDTIPPYEVTWDTTKTSNGAHALTVAARDAAGNIGVSAALSVTVNNSTEFVFSMPPGSSTSLTTLAGGSATFNMVVAPSTGFTGSITFTCTGMPQLSTCTVSPNPANVSGTAATAVAVSIATTARSSARPTIIGRTGGSGRALGFGTLLGTALLVGGMVLTPKWRRRRGAALWLMTAMLLVIVSCGGGSSSAPGQGVSSGTPSGTFTITVAGSSGTVTHTYDLKLTVN